MCKLSILALGADLYYSAFKHFETLTIIIQYGQQVLPPGSSSIYRILMDMTAYFIALMTLVLTFRGRVNRHMTGRIVLPVLTVKFMLEIQQLQQQRHQGEHGKIELSNMETIMFLKSVLLITITAKLAFGNDKSKVEANEWLPKSSNSETDDSSASEFYVHKNEETSQPEVSGKEKTSTKKIRNKKRK